jgi:hypothetical protein
MSAPTNARTSNHPRRPHQNGLAPISGETRPGIRTPTTWHLHP